MSDTIFRYVDDIVLLGNTKQELRTYLKALKQELSKLNLKLKDNWQIFPVEIRGIDFLGYRFFHRYTLLRKRIKHKIFKRLAQYRKGNIQEETFNKSMAAWNGWLKWCDSTNLTCKINKIVNNIKSNKYDSTKRQQT